MRIILVTISLLLAACLDHTDPDDYPIYTGGGVPSVGGPDATDDVHCPAAWTEIVDSGVCHRSLTANPPPVCPAGFVDYTADHNLGLSRRVCHCPTGRAEFGACAAQAPAPAPDHTDCPLYWTPVARGICGLVPGGWYRGPVGTMPKTWRSYLTAQVRVYVSRQLGTGEYNLVVTDDEAGTLRAYVVDSVYNDFFSTIAGKTEGPGPAYLDEVYPWIPEPDGEPDGVSWLMFAWSEF